MAPAQSPVEDTFGVLQRDLENGFFGYFDLGGLIVTPPEPMGAAGGVCCCCSAVAAGVAAAGVAAGVAASGGRTPTWNEEEINH
ncbi:hypothetical protein PRIPAC_79498 [Pristionchus pacificus]|uniref:Uncharacterized protein n=1 Tax=Pristionchus pacificus TaxID=54126 RepID=A0A2A6BVF3_PRIPA|nr:hypothetical protein PRIPAC_79498 [Pristionchus pacificus]|eukprot:PDM69865.1 hypothetical protein PRIPAC_49077 [Pristionchus pacificus]